MMKLRGEMFGPLFQHKEDDCPYWVIEVEPKMMGHITTYTIDGNTGECTKEEKYVPRIE